MKGSGFLDLILFEEETLILKLNKHAVEKD